MVAGEPASRAMTWKLSRRSELAIASWRARQDSNLWPSAPEADALSS